MGNAQGESWAEVSTRRTCIDNVGSSTSRASSFFGESLVLAPLPSATPVACLRVEHSWVCSRVGCGPGFSISECALSICPAHDRLTCWYRPDELAVRATFLITVSPMSRELRAV
jgi:hypothetical protein